LHRAERYEPEVTGCRHHKKQLYGDMKIRLFSCLSKVKLIASKDSWIKRIANEHNDEKSNDQQHAFNLLYFIQ